MCNQYRPPEAAGDIVRMVAATDHTGNQPWPEDAFPDRLAPIIRYEKGGLEVAQARWGMPTPDRYLPVTGRDSGITNIRNVESFHWSRWLSPEHRCLVPVTIFSEPGRDRKPVWFGLNDNSPMMFAGIEVRGWKSIRKVRDGETVDDLFGFLTCAPNAEVAAVHPKAMPVILRNEEEWKAWMELPWEKTRSLQCPLPDGSLVTIEPS